MAKPRKSTFDAFVDQFCGFNIEAQEKALELMSFEHRRARIRAVKESIRATGQPVTVLLDGIGEMES